VSPNTATDLNFAQPLASAGLESADPIALPKLLKRRVPSTDFVRAERPSPVIAIETVAAYADTAVTDGAALDVALANGVRVDEGDVPRVGDAVGELDTVRQREIVFVGDVVLVRVADAELVADFIADADDVREAVDVRDVEIDRVHVSAFDREALPETLGVALDDADRDVFVAEDTLDARDDGEATLAVALTDGDSDGDDESDTRDLVGRTLIVPGKKFALRDDSADVADDADTDALEEADAVDDAELELESVDDDDRDSPERVPDGVAEFERENRVDTVGACVLGAVADDDRDLNDDGLTLGDAVVLGLALCVFDGAGERVAHNDAEGEEDGSGEPERVDEDRVVADDVVLTEGNRGDELALRDVDPVKDGERDTSALLDELADCDGEPLILAVEEEDALTLEVPEPVAVVQEDTTRESARGMTREKEKRRKRSPMAPTRSKHIKRPANYVQDVRDGTEGRGRGTGHGTGTWGSLQKQPQVSLAVNLPVHGGQVQVAPRLHVGVVAPRLHVGVTARSSPPTRARVVV
jgi:hypothetical protein